LLEWTTNHLKQCGAANPRLDAEVLLAEARNCQRIELYTQFDVVADQKVRTAFRELVRRRAEGTPVAYLVGRREFYSLSFQVTPDVLIPRSETEFVVVTLLDLVRRYAAGEHDLEIADVGTGCGVLAVCAAREITSARITATDISQKALAVAHGNARAHGVADRIELVAGDLLSCVPAGRQFDFIISNPPYVSSSEYEQLAPEVKDHEPRIALDGGPDGTSVIGRLVGQAAERLRPGGWLIFEISPMIESRVVPLLQQDGHFEGVAIVNDLAQLARVAKAKKRRQGD
jgi:release factor glutamine methyltransferase